MRLSPCCCLLPALSVPNTLTVCPSCPPTPTHVHATGLIPEVRRRRYFENTVDMKKRKFKEMRMAIKRQQTVRSYSQVSGSGQEPAPFSDMFGGEADLDIFF